jgi:hypothetical protein
MICSNTNKKLSLAVYLAPAGIGTGMAGRALRNGFDQQTIIITIRLDIFQQ